MKPGPSSGSTTWARSSAAALCTVLVLLSLALGQSLEKVIPLPDTFVNVDGAHMAVYSPANNRFYLGSTGDSMVIAVDGTTLAKVALLHFDYHVAAIGCDPATGKIYVGTFSDTVAVVDGNTNAILTRLALAQTPVCFGFDTLRHKVYCAGSDPPDIITVLDAAADTVVGTIDLDWARPEAMLCLPGTDRLYVCTDRGPVIIDTRTDTVVMPAPAVQELECLGVVWSPVENRVYVGAAETLWVIDVAGDSVRKRLPHPLDSYFAGGLAYGPALDQVYTLDDISGGVKVIDCGQDSVVDEILLLWQLPEELGGFCADPFAPKVYCIDEGYDSGYVASCDVTRRTINHTAVGREAYPIAIAPSMREPKLLCADYYLGNATVLDTRSDSLLATIKLLDFTTAVAASPDGAKLYVGCVRGDLLAMDPLTGGVLACLDIVDPVWSLCFGLAGKRLYTSRVDPETYKQELLVFDAGSDTLVARLPLGMGVTGFVPDDARDKLYCLNEYDRAVTVVDQARCSVRCRVNLDNWPVLVCQDSTAGRLYVTVKGHQDIISVVDCEHDSVTARISLPGGAAAMCCDPKRSEIYVSIRSKPDTLFVVDGRRDTVVAGIPVGGNPGSLCLDPADDRIYCAVGDGEVVAVDCRSRSVAARIGVGGQPDRLWYNPASGHIFLTTGERGPVVVIDPVRDSVAATIPVRGYPESFAASDQGEQVYVQSGCPFVSVIRDELPSSRITGVAGTALFRGVMYLRGSSPARLVNASGRSVMTLNPGRNDITGIAAGVYFALPPTRSARPERVVVVK